MANAKAVSFDYTYDGRISTEIFYKPAVIVPEITNLFTVLDMIKSKMQLTLDGVMNKIVKKYTGCAITPSGSLTLDNRTLTVSEVEFRLEQCKDAFEDSWLEELSPFGMQEFELGQALRNLVTRNIQTALTQDNFRILSFGDTGSGSGDYDQLDGLWKRLIDGEATYCVDKIDSITTLNQTTNTRALDYLRNLFEGADIILKQLPVNAKKFYVTGNVYENLLQTYQDKGLDNGLTQETQNGISIIKFNGIEVVPVYGWDQWLSDGDNPFNGTFNTAIIYTTPENHIVGLGTRDVKGVKQWYRDYDRKYYFDGHYRIGYNYVHCDLQAISYGTV